MSPLFRSPRREEMTRRYEHQSRVLSGHYSIENHMAGIEGFEPIQPTVLETAALPIELYPYGRGSRIRTGDAGVKVPCLNHLTIPRYIYSPKKNVNAAAAITQAVISHSSLVISEVNVLHDFIVYPSFFSFS